VRALAADGPSGAAARDLDSLCVGSDSILHTVASALHPARTTTEPTSALAPKDSLRTILPNLEGIVLRRVGQDVVGLTPRGRCP
jgi:hypothetical protein